MTAIIRSSFAPSMSITLWADENNGYRVVTSSPAPERGGFMSSDEVETHVEEMLPEDAAEVVRLLTESRIAPSAESDIGLDGTTYELHVGPYGSGATYEWWSTAPEEWRVLGEVVLMVMAYAGPDNQWVDLL